MKRTKLKKCPSGKNSPNLVTLIQAKDERKGRDSKGVSAEKGKNGRGRSVQEIRRRVGSIPDLINTLSQNFFLYNLFSF
jgi:hypothetical protein